MVIRAITSRTDGTLQEPREDPRDTACWYLIHNDVFWREPLRWAGDNPSYGPGQWSWSPDLLHTMSGVSIASGWGTITRYESAISTHFFRRGLIPSNVLLLDDTAKLVDWGIPESLPLLAERPIELRREYLRIEDVEIRIQESQNPWTPWLGTIPSQLQLVEAASQEASEEQTQMTAAKETGPVKLLTWEPEPSTHPLIVYVRIAIGRILSESRFFANTLKEAFLHPLTASAIDKRTGKVMKQQAQTDRVDVLEQPR